MKFKVKPIFNKSNGQINISLPKRKLPKFLRDNSCSIKSLNLDIEDWEME